MINEISEIEIMNLSDDDLEQLSKEARKLSWTKFGNSIKIYYPNKFFPSISITGTECKQSCLYCDKHYLENMVSITEPKKLEEFAFKLEKNGGKGMLISGGYDEEARVPISPYLDSISKIKSKTNLKINLHCGLVNKDQAKAISEAKVDKISFDIITDDKVISELIRHGKKSDDYLQSYKELVNTGLEVIPHICIGLYYGTEKGNFDAINAALNFNPKLIVFLGLIPTKGTPMENSPILDSNLLSKMLIYTRLKAPLIEQSLGCMRVRLLEYEIAALNSGINRIAVPKSKTLDYIKEKLNLEIKKENQCCAI